MVKRKKERKNGRMEEERNEKIYISITLFFVDNKNIIIKILLIYCVCI